MLSVLLAMSLAVPSNGDSSQAAMVFGRVAPKVVIVHARSKRGVVQGSGVIVGRGIVVTNFHVVQAASELTVSRNGTLTRAALIRTDEKRDLALLEVANLSLRPVALGASSRVKVGDVAYAIGAPQGLELSLTSGIVSAVRGEVGQKLVQFSTPISQGSSGGGLFDASGTLVGVTTFKMGEGLGFAVGAEAISALLAGARDGGTPSDESPWSVTRRPPAVKCEVDADLVWGLFSEGVELLQRTEVTKSVAIVGLDTQAPTMVTFDGKTGRTTRLDLVLHDMKKSVQTLEFSTADAERTVLLAFQDDFDSIRFVDARRDAFKGEPRLLTREGHCRPTTESVIVPSQSGSVTDLAQLAALRKGCERGDVTACREAASRYRSLGDSENAKVVSEKLGELESK